MIEIMKNHKYLLLQMTKKEFKQKYSGSVFGKIWIFVVPIIMLLIYTFVFSEIFQSKWNIALTGKYDFPLILFCGLSVFNSISEVLGRSVSLIQTNINYVKKVVFPLEILPIAVTITAMINCFISFIILIIAAFAFNRTISTTLHQIIFLFLPLFFFCLGLTLFLSSISVYFRDMNSLIQILITIFMYVSPVFFSLEAVPEQFRMICLLNPLTYMIENFRRVVLFGIDINLWYYLISLIVSGIVFFLGKVVFTKAKSGFADVI